MYSLKSYQLTKEEYNYLLPVLRSKLLCRNERFYFVDVSDGLEDMLDRLKGLYNYYEEIKAITIYQCFKIGSIEHFRNEIRN